MRRGMQFFAAIVVGVSVAACSDQSPTVPSSLEPQFLIAPGTTVACDFQDLRTKAAPAYLKNGSTTLRTVKSLIQDMEGFGAGTAGARDIGFQIFEILASQLEAGSPDIDGTAEDGSDFVNKTLACMEPAPYLAVDFTGALDGAGGGALCVRGGATDDPSACVTFDGFSGLSPGPNSSFPGWFGGRRLVYAAPLAVFISNEVVVGGEYEWSTVPAAALNNANGKGVVGMCVPNPLANAVNRVQHREEGDAATILLLADAFFLDGFLPCDNFASLDRGPSTPLFRFARSVFDWASPPPLYASVLKLGGGTGGTIGDLSKFAVVNAQAVNLEFTTQPVDGLLNQPMADVVVRAFGDGDTPFIDLSITLQISVNNSVNATLDGPSCTVVGEVGTCTLITDANGEVTFSGLTIDKTGGYRFLATTTDLPLSSPDAAQVVSDGFNIHP